eukprot:7134187-Prymnesium_polylepis.1
MGHRPSCVPAVKRHNGITAPRQHPHDRCAVKHAIKVKIHEMKTSARGTQLSLTNGGLGGDR